MMRLFGQPSSPVLVLDDGGCRLICPSSVQRNKEPDVAVVNLSSLDIRFDVLPPMRRRDREKLMARRLAENFPNASVRYAVADRMPKALLVAADVDAGGSAALSKVSRVIFAPFVLRALAERLRLWPQDAWGMLVIHHDDGVRMVVMQGNALMLTRDISLSDHTPQDMAMTIAYAARLGLRDPRHFHVCRLGGGDTPSAEGMDAWRLPCPVRTLSWGYLSSLLGTELRDFDQLLAFSVRFCTARDKVPAAAWSQAPSVRLASMLCVMARYAPLPAIVSLLVAVMAMIPAYQQGQDLMREGLALSLQQDIDREGEGNASTRSPLHDQSVLAERHQRLFSSQKQESLQHTLLGLDTLRQHAVVWTEAQWSSQKGQADGVRITLLPNQSADVVAAGVRDAFPLATRFGAMKGEDSHIVLHFDRSTP